MGNKLLKSLLNFFNHLTTFFILPCIFISCQMDFNLNADNSIHYEGSECWMQNVDDSTLIRCMTIPGTHDTCATHDFIMLSSTAAAQDMKLRQLLDAGVRQVDIRIYNNGSELLIHHGITYQYMSYDDVLNICYSFLEENPTETILFFIKSEWQCTDADICDGVLSRINANTEKWITAESAETLTLGECRGKLILVKRFSGLTGTGISGGSAAGLLHQLHGGKTSDTDEYWNLIKSDLDSMRDSADPSFSIVWTAAYFEGQFGIPNIRVTSSKINPLVQEYLKESSGTKNHYGIIGMDHITTTLAHEIYSVNLTD